MQFHRPSVAISTFEWDHHLRPWPISPYTGRPPSFIVRDLLGLRTELILRRDICWLLPGINDGVAGQPWRPGVKGFNPNGFVHFPGEAVWEHKAAFNVYAYGCHVHNSHYIQ